MDDLNILRRMRAGAPGPSARHLQDLRFRLLNEMTKPVPARRRGRVWLGPQLALAGGLAATAAVAVFAAAAATGSFPRHPGGTLPAETTAYVLSRTERALAAATEGHLIEEIRAAARGQWFILGENNSCQALSPGGCPKDFNRGLATDAVYLTYRGQFREVGFSAAGRTLWTAGVTARPAASSGRQAFAGVGVDYPTRTWWSYTTHQGFGFFETTLPTGCSHFKAHLDWPIGDPSGWDSQIHNALSCGTFRVAGHQRVDGVDTIKIVAVKRIMGPYTLWVSPSTYLPVRANAFGLTGNFHWLAPTKANLATFHVRVPETFRRVPATGLPSVETETR